jgi:hypothetical protein
MSMTNYAEYGTLWGAAIISWLIVGVRVMGLCRTSGVAHGWLAFVPVANFIVWARLAGANPWLVLTWIFPPIGAIFSFVWLYRISVHTRSTTPWFWFYLVIKLVTFAVIPIGGTVSHLISLVGTLVVIGALWIIFDPAKPIRTAARA